MGREWKATLSFHGTYKTQLNPVNQTQDLHYVEDTESQFNTPQYHHQMTPLVQEISNNRKNEVSHSPRH